MIAVSVVFAPALKKFAEFLDLSEELEIRDKYPVIVGGGLTMKRGALHEGADGWGAQAKDALDLATGILKVA